MDHWEEMSWRKAVAQIRGYVGAYDHRHHMMRELAYLLVRTDDALRKQCYSDHRYCWEQSHDLMAYLGKGGPGWVWVDTPADLVLACQSAALSPEEFEKVLEVSGILDGALSSTRHGT